MNEILQRLKENDPTLTLLDLAGNSISAAEIKDLAEALKTNKILTTLKLTRSQIGDAGVKELAEALKTNSTLTHLHLDENNIGDAGVEQLAEVLKRNSTLTHLNLDKNNIGDTGVEKLAEALKRNSTLTGLYLENNHIGDAGVDKLVEALETNSLSVLFLPSSEIIDFKRVGDRVLDLRGRNRDIRKLTDEVLHNMIFFMRFIENESNAPDTINKVESGIALYENLKKIRELCPQLIQLQSLEAKALEIRIKLSITHPVFFESQETIKEWHQLTDIQKTSLPYQDLLQKLVLSRFGECLLAASEIENDELENDRSLETIITLALQIEKIEEHGDMKKIFAHALALYFKLSEPNEMDLQIDKVFENLLKIEPNQLSETQLGFLKQVKSRFSIDKTFNRFKKITSPHFFSQPTPPEVKEGEEPAAQPSL